MKPIRILFLILLFLASRPVVAQDAAGFPPAGTGSAGGGEPRFFVGIGGGYGGVSLAEAERNLELLVRAEREYFEGMLPLWGSTVVGTPVARLQEVTGGGYVMTEAGWHADRHLDAGIRFYRYLLPDLVGLFSEDASGGESIRADHRFTLGMTKVLAGLQVGRRLSGGRGLLQVGVHGGPVFFRADSTLSVEQTFFAGETIRYSQEIPYAGTGWAVDLGLEIEWGFRRGWALVAEAGYSLASVSELKVRRDTPVGPDGESLPKGTVLVSEIDGNPIGIDLGGLRAGAGLRARF